MSQRPARPVAVSRELRQEAGFGCVRCGKPILQYHHIEGYDEQDPYPVHKMIVFCPEDHDRASKGLFTLDQQYEFKANPRNKRDGTVTGLLEIADLPFNLAMAGGTFAGEEASVIVDGEELLRIRREDDQLLVTLRLWDADADRYVALVVDNEWLGDVATNWDIEADYRRLTVRAKEHAVALRILGTNEQLRVAAVLRSDRATVRITPTRLRYSGEAGKGVLTGVSAKNAQLIIDNSSGVVDVRADSWAVEEADITFSSDVTLGSLAGWSFAQDLIEKTERIADQHEILGELVEVAKAELQRIDESFRELGSQEESGMRADTAVLTFHRDRLEAIVERTRNYLGQLPLDR